MKQNIKKSVMIAGITALMFGGIGISSASADVWNRDVRQDRQDIRFDKKDARHDVRDIKTDHKQIGSLDRRLENQVEHGRYGLAQNTENRIDSKRFDIQRDKRDLNFDRRDINFDRHDLRRDW